MVTPGSIIAPRRAALRRRQIMKRALWIVQIVLGLLFVFAGGAKLAMTTEQLAQAAPQLSATFMQFVAVCELLGGLGLILPSALRIMPGLTPLAAAGLVVIMIGAVTVTVLTLGPLPALLPAIVGILCAWVAYGRWRVLPIAGRPADVQARV
jgi:uncharacterized membrane protein YphA (DoxX/SURF4 family)